MFFVVVVFVQVFLAANKRYPVRAPSEWKSLSIAVKTKLDFLWNLKYYFCSSHRPSPMQSKLSRQFFFIYWEIPINLRPIENLNLFGIFCGVSISLLNTEAVAGTGGFPSNFRSYTRTFAQWRSRPLFQCRYKITETRAQVLFLFPSVPDPPSRIEVACSRRLVYLLVFKR